MVAIFNRPIFIIQTTWCDKRERNLLKTQRWLLLSFRSFQSTWKKKNHKNSNLKFPLNEDLNDSDDDNDDDGDDDDDDDDNDDDGDDDDGQTRTEEKQIFSLRKYFPSRSWTATDTPKKKSDRNRTRHSVRQRYNSWLFSLLIPKQHFLDVYYEHWNDRSSNFQN